MFSRYICFSIILCLIWFILIAWIKVAALRNNVVVGDLYLWANSLANTNFSDKFLYNAGYRLDRGILSLIQDHYEPSSALLTLFAGAPNIPLMLVLYQALAGVMIVVGLLAVSRHWRMQAWTAWAICLVTLYNPYFIDAVVDAVYGFHHDAQFLVYTPLFLASFILGKPFPTYLCLLLFLGVKEDAAFFGLTLGAAATLLGWPSSNHRRLAIGVAAISLVWAVMVTQLLPRMVGITNIYAAQGLDRLSEKSTLVAVQSLGNFFKMGWHDILLAFPYAVGAPALFAASLPDIAIFSVLPHFSNLYYNFNIIIFLAFASLATLARFPPEGSRYGRPLRLALLIQLAVIVPYGLHEMGHLYSKWINRETLSRPVTEADGQRILSLIDPNCTVATNGLLFASFYRLPNLYIPYLFRNAKASSAHYLLSVDPAALASPSHDQDYVDSLTVNGQAGLHFVGTSGVVQVWENPSSPCTP